MQHCRPGPTPRGEEALRWAAPLLTGALAIAVAGLALVVISWKRRAVLASVAGALGIALVAFGMFSGRRDGAAAAALVIALMFVIIGVALYSLGQALERLLDEHRD